MWVVGYFGKQPIVDLTVERRARLPIRGQQFARKMPFEFVVRYQVLGRALFMPRRA